MGGGHGLRFSSAPLIAQGPVVRILSLSGVQRKVQVKIFGSRELKDKLVSRFHAVSRTKVIAQKLMVLLDINFPTRVRSLVELLSTSLMVSTRGLGGCIDVVSGVTIMRRKRGSRGETIRWGQRREVESLV